MPDPEACLLTTVGDVAVYRVHELLVPTSVRWLLPDATREAVEPAKEWLQPYFMDADGYLLQSVQTYVLQTAGRTILIDTGVGNHKTRGGAIPAFNMLETPLLDRLASIGVRPGDVDTVLCTHMHTDHVGWDARLEDGSWRPTFPNARHLFVRQEYEHFESLRQTAAASAQVWQDSIEPVARAGLIDLVPPDQEIAAGVRLEPSFGHTPGHVSVKVESGGAFAVFIGDAVHSPLQVALPSLRCALGGPEEPSRLARLALLERYAGTDTAVFGAHFGYPCGGYVRRDGAAFRFEAISVP